MIWKDIRDKFVTVDPSPAPKAPEHSLGPIGTHLSAVPPAREVFGWPADHSTAPPQPTVGATSNAYQRLRDKTDFDQTDAGRSLKKYLTPLANLGVDEHTKMKAAAAQAQAQDGLTSEKILTTFDSLKQALLDEQAHFQDFVKTTTAHEIGERQTKIEATQKQIDQAQQTVIQLTTELAQARGRLDHGVADFNSALATRTEELEQQKAHFTSLLQ